jgi:hypothetical protein
MIENLRFGPFLATVKTLAVAQSNMAIAAGFLRETGSTARDLAHERALTGVRAHVGAARARGLECGATLRETADMRPFIGVDALMNAEVVATLEGGRAIRNGAMIQAGGRVGRRW